MDTKSKYSVNQWWGSCPSRLFSSLGQRSVPKGCHGSLKAQKKKSSHWWKTRRIFSLPPIPSRTSQSEELGIRAMSQMPRLLEHAANTQTHFMGFNSTSYPRCLTEPWLWSPSSLVPGAFPAPSPPPITHTPGASFRRVIDKPAPSRFLLPRNTNHL